MDHPSPAVEHLSEGADDPAGRVLDRAPRDSRRPAASAICIRCAEKRLSSGCSCAAHPSLEPTERG